MPAMGKEYASLRRRPFLAPVWIGALLALFVLAAAAWAVLAASTTLVAIARIGSPVVADLAGYCARAPAEGLAAVVVVCERALAGSCRGTPFASAGTLSGDALRSFVLERYRGRAVLILVADAEYPAVFTAFAGAGERSGAEAVVVAVPRFSRPALLRWPLP
jgi:hypothetical protein